MVEGVRLRPASGIALRRPGAGFTAALNGQEVGDFDPARGGGFCPANGGSPPLQHFLKFSVHFAMMSRRDEFIVRAM